MSRVGAIAHEVIIFIINCWDKKRMPNWGELEALMNFNDGSWVQVLLGEASETSTRAFATHIDQCLEPLYKIC